MQYHNGLKSWSESKKHNVKTPRKLFKHAHSVPDDCKGNEMTIILQSSVKAAGVQEVYYKIRRDSLAVLAAVFRQGQGAVGRIGMIKKKKSLFSGLKVIFAS